MQGSPPPPTAQCTPWRCRRTADRAGRILHRGGRGGGGLSGPHQYGRDCRRDVFLVRQRRRGRPCVADRRQDFRRRCVFAARRGDPHRLRTPRADGGDIPEPRGEQRPVDRDVDPFGQRGGDQPASFEYSTDGVSWNGTWARRAASAPRAPGGLRASAFRWVPFYIRATGVTPASQYGSSGLVRLLQEFYASRPRA